MKQASGQNQLVMVMVTALCLAADRRAMAAESAEAESLATSSRASRLAPETAGGDPFQRGGIYDRPYVANLGGRTSVGGYAEMNSNYIREDGISEGFSQEFRRFNIFLFSSISENVRLTSELEFEHGTEEIGLETALVDLLLHTSINFRAGILLSPIGKFNIAHDSPLYNVVDRPLVSTQIIPATLSEVGVGLFGGFYLSPADRITYELYAVNGLGDGVVSGSGEGTRIPAGKSEAAFEEDNNGSPSLVTRWAYNPRFGGEVGASLHYGRYNTDRIEGVTVAEALDARIVALDAEYEWKSLHVRGEAAWAAIEVPKGQVDTDFTAEKQRGYYVEGNFRLFRGSVSSFQEAAILAFARYDDVDLNEGTFDVTGQRIGDASKRMTVGLAFRPSPDTVYRLSYFRQWDFDEFNNRTNAMNLQAGVATYF